MQPVERPQEVILVFQSQYFFRGSLSGYFSSPRCLGVRFSAGVFDVLRLGVLFPLSSAHWEGNGKANIACCG